MKRAFTVFLSILSFSVFASTTITKLTLDDEGRTIRMAPGFDDSSFYYKSQAQTTKIVFCFNGIVEDVCDLIKDFENDKMQRYAGGDHDYMVVNSCVPTKDFVNAEYLLLDDYQGNFLVTKKIEACNTFLLREK